MEDIKIILGWKEWVSLPDLNIPAVKAKVDTGAKTSALHAFYIETFDHQGDDFISFSLHPLPNKPHLIIHCKAPLLTIRKVTNSGGYSEKRYVIETRLVINHHEWTIELNLTDRESMSFRMLLGREAMTPRVIVDPEASFLAGKLNPLQLY